MQSHLVHDSPYGVRAAAGGLHEEGVVGAVHRPDGNAALQLQALNHAPQLRKRGIAVCVPLRFEEQPWAGGWLPQAGVLRQLRTEAMPGEESSVSAPPHVHQGQPCCSSSHSNSTCKHNPHGRNCCEENSGRPHATTAVEARQEHQHAAVSVACASMPDDACCGGGTLFEDCLQLLWAHDVPGRVGLGCLHVRLCERLRQLQHGLCCLPLQGALRDMRCIGPEHFWMRHVQRAICQPAGHDSMRLSGCWMHTLRAIAQYWLALLVCVNITGVGTQSKERAGLQSL